MNLDQHEMEPRKISTAGVFIVFKPKQPRIKTWIKIMNPCEHFSRFLISKIVGSLNTMREREKKKKT